MTPRLRRPLGTVLAIALVAAGFAQVASARCVVTEGQAAVRLSAACCCGAASEGTCASFCSTAPQPDQRQAVAGPTDPTPCAMTAQACRMRHSLQPHAPPRIAHAPAPSSPPKRYLAFCTLRL